MKLRTFSRVVASLVYIFSSAWAFAHHGTAAYEMASPTSIKGKVVEFEWANPHATIVFEAKDEKGAVRKLEVETNSPNLLHRAGWTKQTIKPGQEMTIFGFRGKDGVATFRMEKIVWPDGRETTPSNATSLKY